MKIDLPGWNTSRVEESAKGFLAHATYGPEPKCCQHCGAGLYRHGTRTQEIKDVPRGSKRVTIRLNRNRYRCATCGKTVLQPLPDVDQRAQMTQRLRRWIEEQSAGSTNVAIAEMAGVNEKTVRNLVAASA
jgi:transposase